jgi:hypothetical protein
MGQFPIADQNVRISEAILPNGGGKEKIRGGVLVLLASPPPLPSGLGPWGAVRRWLDDHYPLSIFWTSD